MKTPTELMADLESLFKLKQKGSVSEGKYLSMKKNLMKNILNNEEYYLSLDNINDAERLRDKQIITEKECSQICQLALEDNDPEVQKKKKEAEESKAAMWENFKVLLFLVTIPFRFAFWILEILVYGKETVFLRDEMERIKHDDD